MNCVEVMKSQLYIGRQINRIEKGMALKVSPRHSRAARSPMSLQPQLLPYS